MRIRSTPPHRSTSVTLLGRPDVAGPVTLRASGVGRWRTVGRSLRGSVTVEPSRLGRVEVTAGSMRVKLRGERLRYDGSLRTNGGALALAGDGRPLDEVPYFAIRRGQADSIDIGSLLG